MKGSRVTLALSNTSNRYDTAGRQIATIDAAGLVTAYAYPGPLTSVTISPGVSRRSGGAAEADGLLTNTTVRYPDGRARYTEQNGIRQTTYSYGPAFTTVYTGPAGLASPVWQKTTTDLLGRTIRTESPGFSVSSVPFVATNSSFYNSLGQLIRTTSTGQADTLYVYDSLGQQFRSGLDLNRNGILDLSGPDRVSESFTAYQSDGSDYWQVSASILYPHDGSAAPVTNALQRTRLTGLGLNSAFGIQNSEFISQDLLGNSTLSRTFVDRDSKTVTQTTLYPDSTNAATQVTINGLAQYSISKTGVRTDAGYDALSRQISGKVDAASPPRSVGSVTHYNSLGQVDWVADALSNRTTFAYSPTTGRRISVTDALSNTTYTAYDPEGRVTATWGATYPVAYAYDAYGRMVVMATFRVEGGAGDQTQWRYDKATGLLTNKVYADATPDVTFAYDRLGRQVAITDATGTRSFAYNDAFQLAAETNAFGTITRQYDLFGRSSGLAVGASYQVGYGYSGDGRFAAVTSSVQSVSSVVEYSYLPGTDILSGWTNSAGFAVTRAFEPHRDLLTAVSNRYNGATVSAFDYINDSIARRTQRIDSGSATATNAFGYNPRSELIVAAMCTNSYGYAYDPIGNRLAATNNDEVLTYLANALNQYTNIADGLTLTPVYDLDGNMTNYNGWTFAWSGENRLILASNAQHLVTYAYDYQGRMVWKQVSTNAVVLSTRTLLWDGYNIIQSLTHTQTHTLTNSYLWGLDLSGTLQGLPAATGAAQAGAGGVGGLLAEVQDGSPYFAAFDANGNVTEYLSTNGAIAAHYEYSPFGEIVVQSGDLADAFTHRFSTKPWCSVTGLSEYEFRKYSPGVGRWLSRDPIGEEGWKEHSYFKHDSRIAKPQVGSLVEKIQASSDAFLGLLHMGIWDEARLQLLDNLVRQLNQVAPDLVEDWGRKLANVHRLGDLVKRNADYFVSQHELANLYLNCRNNMIQTVDPLGLWGAPQKNCNSWSCEGPCESGPFIGTCGTVPLISGPAKGCPLCKCIIYQL